MSKDKMMKILSNEQLTIQVQEWGAELSSIVSKAKGKEYVWQADPIFWKRHSPVLFPIVGSVWENTYRYGGKTYSLSQHGFARDRKFKLVEETPSEIRFSLESDEETLRLYPFPFHLVIGYRLEGNKVEVLWSVKNAGVEKMYFQIGAHPAFYYSDYQPARSERGYFSFDRTEGLRYSLIQDKGCVAPATYPLILEDGLLPIDMHTFDKDALIFENSQLRKVTLLDTCRKPYLSLHFTAPVVGLWSPPAKNAPFVCIEPWYGRCDRAQYTGDFENKDWMQTLQPGETFATSYTIEIEGI